MTGSAERLHDHDASDLKRDTRGGLEDVLKAGVSGRHQEPEAIGALIEVVAKEIGYGEHEMAISHAGEKPPPDEIGPLDGVGMHRKDRSWTCT